MLVRPDSEVKANLVSQTAFLELIAFPVPAVQTRRKVGNSDLSYRNYEKVPIAS